MDRSHARTALEALPLTVLSRIVQHAVLRSPTAYDPAALVPLLCASKTLHGKLTLDGNPELYRDLYRATFDTAALARRYPWLLENHENIRFLGRACKDVLSDPRMQGAEYISLWATARRATAIVNAGTAIVPGIATSDDIVPDLWRLWFLTTENGTSIAATAAELMRQMTATCTL